MANSIQHKRREKFYEDIVSKIIAEDVTNVNISDPTVTSVKLSNDGSHLKVFLTFLSNPNRSLEHLTNAKGFIRHQIAKYGNQRIVPNLEFEIDNTFDKARKIEAILNKIKNEKK